jgi:hypothetical protein
MAKITDLSDAKHRKLAEQFIDRKLLERLPTAELRHRVAHAAQLREHSTHAANRDHAASLFEQSRKVLRAEPVVDYIHKQRELAEAQRKAPAHLSGIYWASINAHRDKHAYEPALLNACEMTLEARAVLGDDQLAATASACVDRFYQDHG